jgi:adenylate kinase family enzyme
VNTNLGFYSMEQKTVLFFGRSGSGKGTQAKLLVDYLKNKTGANVLYIETGGMGREFVSASDSLTGKIIQDIMTKGGLWPEFFPIWLWSNHLIKNFTGSEHVILDGSCRRLMEASILDSTVKFYKIKNPVAILLDVSNEWAKERLIARARKDDDMKAIDLRLSWFDGNVMEAITFFQNNSDWTFHTIKGDRSIEEIHKEIVERIS